MKKIILLAFVLVLLLMSMFGTRLVITVSGSTTHHVYPGRSIQEAIISAQSGDTIIVHNGTYYENVIVSKSLSLVGENRNTTIIDANGDGHVIEVTADNILITGFTIRKSGCGCQLKSGVYIKSYHQNVNVTNNLIIQNGYGIRLDHAHNITIASNNITDNTDDGVYLSGSSNNTILRNNITNNHVGIYLSSSSNNILFHNNFVNNTKQVMLTESYNNTWDDGYPSGGNYWSDYTDIDQYSGPHQNETGSDGIWDHPYVINGDNQDNYPLTDVIPEFPSLTSILTILILLTATMSIYKRRLLKTPIH